MSLDFTLEIDVEDFCASIEKLDKATQDYVQEALVQVVQAVALRARQLAPVRTGQLMQSIYAIGAGQWAVKFGAYAPYALFQEFGTSHNQPRYFLTRALQESAPQLLSAISIAVQRAVEEASQ
ncbi:MAG: HK97-gp10 family putative phage morphogenesis protein [Candidatus Bathyarchaeia archaeon]